MTLPYIVRVERGTMNRGIYDIAVLFDPTQPAWTATRPQRQWNGKLLYTYGASTGQPRLQFRSEQFWILPHDDAEPFWRGFVNGRAQALIDRANPALRIPPPA